MLNFVAMKGYAIVFVPYQTLGVTVEDRYANLVITSYSIHYTKLYDAGMVYEMLPSMFASFQVARSCRMPDASEMFIVNSTTDGIVYRITSYNVCYTKLLRGLSASMDG